mmetsp:Transcript_4112/g.15367  ORF Transcript_4112/g.15367 Transcript_4112/m.15367 type:complete len:208 (-) Transcript_4112:827-1450(-)
MTSVRVELEQSLQVHAEQLGGAGRLQRGRRRALLPGQAGGAQAGGRGDGGGGSSRSPRLRMNWTRCKGWRRRLVLWRGKACGAHGLGTQADWRLGKHRRRHGQLCPRCAVGVPGWGGRSALPCRDWRAIGIRPPRCGRHPRDGHDDKLSAAPDLHTANVVETTVLEELGQARVPQGGLGEVQAEAGTEEPLDVRDGDDTELRRATGA